MHRGPTRPRVVALATVPRVYGFLRRPRWIAFSLLIVTLMVVMVNLGLWQLRRLDQRQQANLAVTQRSSEPIAPLADLVESTSDRAAIEAVQWRQVQATGTFDLAHEVFVRDRSLDGRAGLHVATPLVLADGAAILVNRGWVPIPQTVQGAPSAPPPPTGQVTVVGRLRPSQQRGLIGPTDPPDGVLAAFARLDVPRIQKQVPETLLPAYVELTSPGPIADLPRLLPLPELDDGPHLSYALQWFAFTVLAAIGWWLMVRRTARQRTQLVGDRPSGQERTDRP
jgi:cytochrome oxidase assembly protein ShyY1